eukprot:CAMPEP_0168698230 /NCGR_PEP_ID=MMETSP0503-20121227/36310_1 /TAXON_ID=89963 /ORGANISM="Heterocapsa rotundata, Strain SCCAP K-0483" /LENGTH=129 /DNA_ID=CAMNT_0008744115 /DNA_START=96 /DNA_END=483 /DNA_ORIENTATION=-
MESGVAVTLGLPAKSAGLFGAEEEAGRVVLPRQGLGEAPLGVAGAEGRAAGGAGPHPGLRGRLGADTGMFLELATKGQTQPLRLAFGAPAEREAWARYVDLAVKVLTPDGERAALDAARAAHRQMEIEE